MEKLLKSVSSFPLVLSLFRCFVSVSLRRRYTCPGVKKMEEYAGKQGNEEILSYLVDVNKQECLFTFLFHL